MPRDGGVSPHIIRNSVDLPAPFGPSRAVTPWSMAKLTSLTATTDPKNFDTSFTAIIPVSGGGGTNGPPRAAGADAASSRGGGGG